MSAITDLLEAIHSERDQYGNTYWALRYTDVATGKVAEGTVSGGESNIYAILRNWDVPNDWDRSIHWRVTCLKKRAFKTLTKEWPYAGCGPEELASFIRKQLSK